MQYIPTIQPDIVHIDKKNIAVKLHKMAEDSGALAIWGTGRIFNNFIESELLVHPDIHLVDTNAGDKNIHGKKIHPPIFLEEHKIKNVVIAVFPGTVPYVTIRDEAIQKYKAEKIINIYQLLDPENFANIQEHNDAPSN
jgi:hypothetical protein